MATNTLLSLGNGGNKWKYWEGYIWLFRLHSVMVNRDFPLPVEAYFRAPLRNPAIPRALPTGGYKAVIAAPAASFAAFCAASFLSIERSFSLFLMKTT